MSKLSKELVVTGIILDDSHLYTMDEIISRFQIEEAFIHDMLEHGLFERLPVNEHGMRRIQTAVRLHQDLEINMAGAALVLELLDELENLRGQLSILEKHLK